MGKVCAIKKNGPGCSGIEMYSLSNRNQSVPLRHGFREPSETLKYRRKREDCLRVDAEVRGRHLTGCPNYFVAFRLLRFSFLNFGFSIPSFFNRERRVLGWTPRSAAAPSGPSTRQ